MKVVFELDLDKCVACGACVVACMDQNDIRPENGDQPFRYVGAIGPFGAKNGDKVDYLSIGCMHCENAPCIEACPVGCLYKNEMNLTLYDNSHCIGCHSCAMACPFGAPTYGIDGKMRKCDGCVERIKAGLKPACVSVCPFDALTIKTEKEYLADRQNKSLRTISKLITER